jgi:hypothetical protein
MGGFGRQRWSAMLQAASQRRLAPGRRSLPRGSAMRPAFSARSAMCGMVVFAATASSQRPASSEMASFARQASQSDDRGNRSSVVRSFVDWYSTGTGAGPPWCSSSPDPDHWTPYVWVVSVPSVAGERHSSPVWAGARSSRGGRETCLPGWVLARQMPFSPLMQGFLSAMTVC